jgi:Na+/H+ antiporter NhaD/arsenite permease-like protein
MYLYNEKHPAKWRGGLCVLLFPCYMKKWIGSVVNFYFEGFAGMSSWAKTLWIVILIKLFVMFFVLKLFFFRDTLKNKFETDEQRSEYVIDQITK